MPQHLVQGQGESWCRRCFDDLRRWRIEELQALAARNGGSLLSGRYVNSQKHLQWECARGHRWSAIANSVVRGSWCRQCATLQRLSAEARRRAGPVAIRHSYEWRDMRLEEAP
jgi:hypothetical protein